MRNTKKFPATLVAFSEGMIPSLVFANTVVYEYLVLSCMSVPSFSRCVHNIAFAYCSVLIHLDNDEFLWYFIDVESV